MPSPVQLDHPPNYALQNPDVWTGRQSVSPEKSSIKSVDGTVVRFTGNSQGPCVSLEKPFVSPENRVSGSYGAVGKICFPVKLMSGSYGAVGKICFPVKLMSGSYVAVGFQ